MVPPTLTDTSKVTGSATSSPAAGCGLTSVMVAICHFEADWQSAGSASRQKANTGISFRNIRPPLCSFFPQNQSPRTRSHLNFTSSDAISMPIIDRKANAPRVCVSCLCEVFGFSHGHTGSRGAHIRSYMPDAGQTVTCETHAHSEIASLTTFSHPWSLALRVPLAIQQGGSHRA